MPGVAQKVLEVGPFEMQVWVLLLIPPPGQVCGLWLRVWGVYSGGWGPLLVHPPLTPGVRAGPISQQKTKPSVLPPLTRTSALETKCDLPAGARGGPLESGAGTPQGENKPVAQQLKSKEQRGRLQGVCSGVLCCHLMSNMVATFSSLSDCLCPAHPQRTLVAVVNLCLACELTSFPVSLWSSPPCYRVSFPDPHASCFPPTPHHNFHPGWQLLRPPLPAGLCSAIWVPTRIPCWTVSMFQCWTFS